MSEHPPSTPRPSLWLCPAIGGLCSGVLSTVLPPAGAIVAGLALALLAMIVQAVAA